MGRSVEVDNAGDATPATLGASAGGSPRNYRPARQKRSLETERKFLAASETLFAEHGFHATKVSDIIRLSGCSTGSFYHRFVDKEGVFHVMLDRYGEEIDSAVRGVSISREEQGGLEGAISRIIGATIDLMARNIGVYRAAEELAHRDHEIWERLYALTERAGGELVRRLMAEFGDEIAPPVGTRLQHGLQLIILISMRKQMGGGPMLPDDREAMIAMQRNAVMGVLRGPGAL